MEAVPNFPTLSQLRKAYSPVSTRHGFPPRPLLSLHLTMFLLDPLPGPGGPHRAAARRGSAGDKFGHVTDGVRELESIGWTPRRSASSRPQDRRE